MNGGTTGRDDPSNLPKLEMAFFRFLHLSDFHVGKKPDVLGGLDVRSRPQYPIGRLRPWRASSWNEGLGHAVYDFALRNHAAHPLDAILVTGDLATTGRKVDIVRSLEYIELLGRGIRWTTGPANHPDQPIRRLILFPGNHDRFRPTAFWPGCRRFDNVFRQYWQGPVQSTVLQDAVTRERLTIIQADFALQKRSHASWTSFDYLGQGRVYQPILDSLVNETHRHKLTGAVVWAVHFPPAYDKIEDSLRLQNQMMLLYAAGNSHVPCIFAGHTHDPRPYKASGVDVYCAGTATQLVVPPGVTNNINSIHPCTIEVSDSAVLNVDWQEWKYNPFILGFQRQNPSGPTNGWIA